MIVAAWIALFSPAAAVVAIALAGRRLSRRGAGVVASASTLVSFVCSVVALATLLGRDAEARFEQSSLWTWLSAGDLRFGLEIVVDPLSVFMMLVVSGVGFLILSYAVGYMHDDDEERRYHAYKALFVFSMLLLVQSGNLLLLLAGWGMVGLSSYLLINFWHARETAVHAGKKAFVMNAFGDATFALALFLLVQQVGALDFATVFSRAPLELDEGGTVAVLVALGLLGGAVAKSAQVPLHTWLPDAMEGPTPVSALIHAATMVTAGVYLIARTATLFELAPIVQDTAAVLGAVTLLVAGLVALVQTDIKRVIAYSTMSQIGYMFVGVGLGAYGAGMFHLMTHAFFKALLFLGAGVVIHALAGEQDIRKMRGLAKELPTTYRFFLVGVLSLAALPPLSGFFSKDAILASAVEEGALGWALWALAIVGAGLTAVYSLRLLFIVFAGEPSDFVRSHLHKERSEGPLAMMWPVAGLAGLAAVGGWLQVPGGWAAVDEWLHPVAESIEEASGGLLAFSVAMSIAAAVIGSLVAWRVWGTRHDADERLRTAAPAAYRVLEHKLYFDEAYDLAFSLPAQRTAEVLRDGVEEPVVLEPLGGLGRLVRGLAAGFSSLQTGLLRSYALMLAAGVTVIALVFISVR
jgi:NADH-quinone oxidoreductase subunit L